MPRVYIILTMMFVALNCSFAVAQLVVSDPAALAKLVDTVSQGQKLLENIDKQIKATEKTISLIEGNLKRSSSLVQTISNYKNVLDNIQKSIPNINAEDFVNGRVPDMSKPDAVKDMLDQIYKNHEVRGDLSKDMRNLYKQNSNKAALEAAELAINNADARFSEIADLTAEIDSTVGLKDASDMGNKLLLKILFAIEDLKNLQAQLLRLEAANSYKGLPVKRTYKPKKITSGEKLEIEITRGENMFKNNICSQDMKKSGLCVY